jgi:hypothetical protein
MVTSYVDSRILALAAPTPGWLAKLFHLPLQNTKDASVLRPKYLTQLICTKSSIPPRFFCINMSAVVVIEVV